MPIMFETIQKFLNHNHLSKSSQRSYRSLLKRLLLFCEGEISVDKIEAFLALQKVSRNSLGNYIAIITSFTKYLYKFGLTDKDYGCHLVRPPRDKIPKDYLTVPECMDLLKTIMEDESRAVKWRLRDYAICVLFLATGMRVSELKNIKLQDLSLHARQVRITRKGGSIQLIPLVGPGVLKTLHDWLKERDKILPKGSKFVPCLFISQRRNNISVNAVQYCVNKWFSKTGIQGKQITPHSLRHTYATNMLNGGHPIQVVSKALGHANLATTNLYAHAMESQLVRAAESFDLESGSLYKCK